jgi:drug/metabolite transporter (DMT)-like permease
MTAVLLALLSAALGGSADFAGGYASKRTPAVVVVAISQFVGLVALVVLTLAVGASTSDSSALGWAALAGPAYLIGIVAFYAALSQGTMGIVAPIAALGVVIPVAWAFVVKHDVVGPAQIAGIVCAIVGVALASGPELEGRAGLRPLLLAAVAGCGYGTSMLLLSEGSADDPVLATLAMRAAVIVALVAVGVGHAASGAIRHDPAGARFLIVVGLLDVSAILGIAFAMKLGPISVVSVVGSLYPVATVVLARLVLKERTVPVQVVGVASALCGIVLLASGA